MIEHDEDESPAGRAARFGGFLIWAKQHGMSQTEVADRLGVPRQYVSNLKTGSRVVTESFARRAAEEFDLNHVWLLHGVGTMHRPSVASQPSAQSGEERLLLPLLSELVSGEPRRSPTWDGALVAITGPAVYSARDSAHPYVYRLAEDDSTGRLKHGDLVLVCQGEPNNLPSKLLVLEVRHRPTLAWSTDGGQWKSARTGRTVSTKSKVIGHCLGMIWAHF